MVVVALPPGTPSFYLAEWLTTRKPPYQVQCSVGWNQVADAKEFQLESGGDGKRLYTGPKAYVSANGNAYCAGDYRVRAGNAGGCSPWSADHPATHGVLNWD